LHLFIAAQPRSIFTEQFQGVKPLHFDAAQEDIQRFATNELKNNYKLKIWRPHAARVIDQVTRKSKGMSVQVILSSSTHFADDSR
jgi:hypothetical protein